MFKKLDEKSSSEMLSCSLLVCHFVVKIWLDDGSISVADYFYLVVGSINFWGN